MSGPSRNKFLLTQSLLSSWQYALKGSSFDEFLSTLRREKKPQSKAMLDGIRFENVVHAVSEGAEITPEQEWYRPVKGDLRNHRTMGSIRSRHRDLWWWTA